MAERIGWPKIVTYIAENGARTACPPRGGVAYTVEIHDRDEYEVLRRNGWLYSREHTGNTGICQDKRTVKDG